MGKMKKKVNLGVLGVSLYVSKGLPQSCLDPNIDLLLSMPSNEPTWIDVHEVRGCVDLFCP